jgi:hypothetical protein
MPHVPVRFRKSFALHGARWQVGGRMHQHPVAGAQSRRFARIAQSKSHKDWRRRPSVCVVPVLAVSRRCQLADQIEAHETVRFAPGFLQ